MLKHHRLLFGKKLVSYAQNGEDIKLYGYFQGIAAPRFYVDVGANHPVHDSVTKFFSLRGWAGINIEPQPDLCDLLQRDRPQDINLAIGLSEKKETITLRKYPGDGLSTYSSEAQTGYENADNPETNEYEEIRQKLTTLRDVLGKHAKSRDIHFLKVDVEGFEFKVLKGNDWKRFRPWVVCIESTGTDKRWLKLLIDAGYVKHMDDGLNSYLVAKEKMDILNSYGAITASEFVRYDIVDMLPIKAFGLLGIVRRAVLAPLRLLNRN